jgi:hypothetical protein
MYHNGLPYGVRKRSVSGYETKSNDRAQASTFSDPKRRHREGNMMYFPLTVLDNDGLAIVTIIDITPGRIIVIDQGRAFFASDIHSLAPLEEPLPHITYESYKKVSGCVVHIVCIDKKNSLFWVTSGLASSKDQVDSTFDGIARYKLVTRRGTILAEHAIWGWKQPSDPPRLGYDYSTPLMHFLADIKMDVEYVMEKIQTKIGVQCASKEYMTQLGCVMDRYTHVPALPVWHSMEIREKCKLEHQKELTQ